MSEPTGIKESLAAIRAHLEPAAPRNYVLDADNSLARALSVCTGYNAEKSLAVLRCCSAVELTQLWYALSTGNSDRVKELIAALV